MSPLYDSSDVSYSVLLYVEFSGCTDTTQTGLKMLAFYTWKKLLGNPLHHSANFTAVWLKHSCQPARLLPPPPHHQPTTSREPWEAESHHHGDLNTDPPHTGPLWLACVEVRGNKMSRQQVFVCFCFCLNSLWDCSQIHVLGYTGGTVRVRETSWLQKRTLTWK